MFEHFFKSFFPLNSKNENLQRRKCIRRAIFWNVEVRAEGVFITSTLKAHLRCKSPSQIGGATWPSGLVEQLKSSGVDDKPSGFIASNEADRLRHPVWLNGVKRQRKADRLRSL